MIRLVLSLATLFAFVGTATAQGPGVSVPSSPDLSGKWSGYWVSDKNNHTGPLNGKFRQIDADTYRVSFSGRFARVIPFWYTTKLDVVGTGEGFVQLAAAQRLPLMGEYRTNATATSTNFDATFTSRRDWGRFVMTRR